MFKGLTPKEDKYFDDFSSMIKTVSEMAALSNEFFCDGKYDQAISLKMKSLERRCDDISHKVYRKLDKSFLTPFDREDIYALIKTLEKVSDSIYAAVTRVIIYDLTTPLPVAEKLISIAQKQINELYKSIVDNKVKVTEDLKRISELEEEADTIYRESVTTLFKEEKNAIELIKRKEILDILEDTTDKCLAVSSIIVTVSLKNS